MQLSLNNVFLTMFGSRCTWLIPLHVVLMTMLLCSGLGHAAAAVTPPHHHSLSVNESSTSRPQFNRHRHRSTHVASAHIRHLTRGWCTLSARLSLLLLLILIIMLSSSSSSSVSIIQHSSTQLNVYSPIKQTRDAEMI